LVIFFKTEVKFKFLIKNPTPLALFGILFHGFTAWNEKIKQVVGFKSHNAGLKTRALLVQKHLFKMQSSCFRVMLITISLVFQELA
jgi:hypothetical protein